jgi:undecaprenyl-diphosphatase
MGITLPGVVLEVVVHLATLVPLLLVYRARVTRLVVGSLRGDREARRYVGLQAVALIPAAVVGTFFQDAVEAVFAVPAVVGVAFLVTGLLLWSTRASLKREPDGMPTLRAAILMGLLQAVALVPGISRSGATVAVALWAGVAGREAAAFSFLMAVPAIAGAALLQVPELQGVGVPWTVLLAGAVSAAVTGVLAIRSFVVLLQKQAFHRFSYYLWPLGLAFLAYLLLT